MTEHKKRTFDKQSIISIVLICIASILLVFAFIGRYTDGFFKAFCNFFLGSFGMSFFGILAIVLVASIMQLLGKRIVIPTRYAINLVAMYVLIVLVVHMFSTTFLNSFGYEEYVYYCYNYYDEVPTFGGVVFGSIAYVLRASLTIWGASILTLALLSLTMFITANFFYALATNKLILNGEVKVKKVKVKKHADQPVQKIEYQQDYSTTSNTEINQANAQPDQQPATDDPVQTPEGRANAMRILFQNVSNDQDNKYDIAPQSSLDDYNPNTPFDDSDKKGYGNNTYNDYHSNNDFFGNNNKPTVEELFGTKDNNNKSSNGYKKEEKDRPSYEKYRRVDVMEDGNLLPKIDLYGENDNINSTQMDSTDIFVEQQPESPFVKNIVTEDNNKQTNNKVNNTNISTDTSGIANLTDDPIVNSIPEDYYFQPTPEEQKNVFDPPVNNPFVVQSQNTTDDLMDAVGQSNDIEQDLFSEQTTQPSNETIQNSVEQPYNQRQEQNFQPTQSSSTSSQAKADAPKVHKYLKYVNPPLEILSEAVTTQDNDADYRVAQADAIVKKLAVFGIKTEALEPVVGSSVTQFRLRVLSDRTRMSDFKAYADDLKSCLESRDDIRIEAPIPGTNLVGIEVANRSKTPVVLRTILQSKEFTHAKGNLVFALGQDISGHNVVADLADMPHLLVAGTTGSGKSVVLNCMITSMIYKYSPEYLRFIMVDPKLVELSRYNGLPHMLTSEAITVTSDALAGMDYLINEMEARYQLFRDTHVGNIKEYNSVINPKQTQKMPYIVLVVDELSDLMSSSKKSFEAKIIRLAQKARAAGIHLVLATQRPSVDVITGLIKANLPCRIALKVGSSQDSRTIIDYGGAEKLLGKGDMLFISSDSPAQRRIQGAYIGNDEIRQLVEYTRSQNETYYPEDAYKSIFLSQQPQPEEEPVDTAETKSQLDPLCKKTLYIWLTKNNGKASIASAQRALPIGFNRAGKIFDSLVTLGCIEDLPANESNSKPRRVLVTLDDLDRLFPDQSID